MVITPATRQVPARTPSNGRPWSWSPSIPAKLRIWGFTKMMYDMTMNVVTPAIVSPASVVPFAANWKRRSRTESLSEAAIADISLLSDVGTVRSERTPVVGWSEEGREWRGPDSNRRHHGFQPCALPTELPRPAGEV